MPNTLSITDPKANNHAGINITDVSYTIVTSGTGLEYQWDGTAGLLLKNSSGAERTFTFTVPVPSGTALSDIGSSPSAKDYIVADGKTLYIRNADSFRDPSTGKGTFDVSGTGCYAVAIAF